MFKSLTGIEMRLPLKSDVLKRAVSDMKSAKRSADKVVAQDTPKRKKLVQNIMTTTVAAGKMWSKILEDSQKRGGACPMRELAQVKLPLVSESHPHPTSGQRRGEPVHRDRTQLLGSLTTTRAVRRRR
eukprot:2002193-Amphidinium_carterae.1